MNRLSVTLKKNEKAIHESVMACAVSKTKVVTQGRDVHKETIEKPSNVWLEDNSQKNVPLIGPLIREKAKLILYDHLVGTGGAANHE